MAKVRVPKEHRPPTRFGIIVGKTGTIEGLKFKVKSYRRPKYMERFWSSYCDDVVIEFWDGSRGPRVILEEVNPRLIVTAPDAPLSNREAP